jgi:hypothetical protein
MSRHVIGLLFGALALMHEGCGQTVTSPHDAALETSGTEKFTFTQNQLWASLESADDPFLSERPAEVDCPEWSHVVEFEALEIDTGTCRYLGVGQKSPMSAKVGDVLHVAVYHDALVAPEPSEGHVAVALGDDVLWEAHFEIPSYPAAYSPKIVLEKDYPEGTQVVFHLHNHGSNNWRLLPMELHTQIPAQSRR